jgi:hypothetical protein
MNDDNELTLRVLEEGQEITTEQILWAVSHIRDLEKRLAQEQEAHAELQAKCFEGQPTFGSIFDERDELKQKLSEVQADAAVMRNVLESARADVSEALRYAVAEAERQMKEPMECGHPWACLIRLSQDQISEALRLKNEFMGDWQKRTFSGVSGVYCSVCSEIDKAVRETVDAVIALCCYEPTCRNTENVVAVIRDRFLK